MQSLIISLNSFTSEKNIPPQVDFSLQFSQTSK